MAEFRHAAGLFSSIWSPGDPWPTEPATDVAARSHRRRARRRQDPPLLTLGLGPFSVAAVPRPQPQRWTEGTGSRGEGGAGGAPPAAAGAAAAVDGPAAELQAVLAAQVPGLADRLAATGEPLDGAFFSRWLKARGGSVEAAAAGVAAHVQWREAFVGAGGIGAESIADELAARKAFLQGHDVGGCPVVVVQAARHDMGKRNLAHTKRLIAFVLDTACATADRERNPAGQIACLFDLSGLRPRNLDVKALAAIFELLQQHYPERLNSLWFVNAPLLFWGVWTAVSPFVHAATRRKIHFIGGQKGRRQLLDRIPAAVLPAQYGGAAELVPIDAAAEAWRQRQQAAEAAAAAAAEAQSQAGSSGGGARGRAAALQRRASGAARAAKRFVHHKVLKPVGGAAAGAARALRRQQSAGSSLQLSEQHGRSLLAQVVLSHVLLMGLLIRLLQRMLSMRRLPAGGEQQGRAASALPPPPERPAEEGGAAGKGQDGPAVPPAGPVEQAVPGSQS